MMHKLTLRNVGIAVGVITAIVLTLTWMGLPWATLLPLGLVALCPLMMIVMMVAMNHGNSAQSSRGHDEHLRQP